MRAPFQRWWAQRGEWPIRVRFRETFFGASEVAGSWAWLGLEVEERSREGMEDREGRVRS